jgi:hypothetical protein
MSTTIVLLSRICRNAPALRQSAIDAHRPTLPLRGIQGYRSGSFCRDA